MNTSIIYFRKRFVWRQILHIFLNECLYIINDIFDTIDVFEGTDVNKTSASKECDVCHYWYFLNYSFKFQPNICNICHDLLMVSVNLNDIAILNIKGPDYHCVINLIRKSETINIIGNADLTEKSGTI